VITDESDESVFVAAWRATTTANNKKCHRRRQDQFHSSEKQMKRM
jgi:hypothetical protein